MQRGFSIAYRTGWLKNNPEYSFHYLDRKLIRPGDFVADIGANLGYYSKLFSRWTGPTGRVFSVEPIALYNEVFREYTRGRKNIELLPYALGAEEKEVELVTALDNGAYNTGLPHVYDSESDGGIEEQDFRFSASMKVPDRLFGNLERLDFVKCDVEGFERVVIENMQRIIDRHLPVMQIEIQPQNEPHLLGWLEGKGYRTFKLDKTVLVKDRERFSSIPGDFLFVPPGRADRLAGIDIK